MRQLISPTQADSPEEEIARCAKDFPYFCRKYVWVNSWGHRREDDAIRGDYQWKPFALHPYQERLADFCNTYPWVIGTKFRQGGFTTFGLMRQLWKCLFDLDKRCLYFCKTDRDAIWASRAVQNAVARLPQWMRPATVANDHLIEFLDTNGRMKFTGSYSASCGTRVSDLFLDEPAFIQDCDTRWKTIGPCLEENANVLCLSTPNGDKGWFHRTYQEAFQEVNRFSVFTCCYGEHPDITPDYAEFLKSNLGEKGWRYEMEQQFQ